MAPSTNKQMLAMVKLRFLNRRRSRSGLSGPQCVDDESAREHDAQDEAHHDGRAGDLAGDPHLGERVDERGQTGGEEGETAEVEAARDLLLVPLEEPARQHEGDDADRHVDVEDPAPAEVGNDQTTRARARGSGPARSGRR